LADRLHFQRLLRMTGVLYQLSFLAPGLGDALAEARQHAGRHGDQLAAPAEGNEAWWRSREALFGSAEVFISPSRGLFGKGDSIGLKNKQGLDGRDADNGLWERISRIWVGFAECELI
jgi:hypothetical protein